MLKGRAPAIVFILSLCVLFYAWGVATLMFRVFPYEHVNAARLAARALLDLEADRLPRHYLGPADSGSRVLPISSSGDPVEEGHILVTGGFYFMLDECPEFGCLAWVMNRRGDIVHSWTADPEAVFSDVTGFDGSVSNLNIYITGLALAPDGGLVTVFQGRNVYPYQVGVAKFDIDGNLEWKRWDYSHHWPSVDADGWIFVPSMRKLKDTQYFGASRTDFDCPTGSVSSEGVRVLSPDGELEHEIWFDEVFAEADLPGLAYALRNGCDPYHVNAIAPLTAAAAGRMRGTKPGDLMVSLREPSALVVIDRESGEFRHMINGRFSAQHSPAFLPDGTLVLFDNKGGKREWGGSRILHIDPVGPTSRPIFPTGREKPGLLPFFTDGAGVVSANAGGNRLLVSESKGGRILELDTASGEVLWEMQMVLDMGAFAESQDLDLESPMARFAAQGAYYVDPGNPVLEDVD